MPRSFVTAFEREHRLELVPFATQSIATLRDGLASFARSPWSTIDTPTEPRRRWLELACAQVHESGEGATVVLHEIANRLRVTRVTRVLSQPYGEVVPELDLAARNRVLYRFRRDLVVPLQLLLEFALEETGPEDDLGRWIGEGALDALERYARARAEADAADDPVDAAAWDAFLAHALPVDDTAGFADAVEAVLLVNGWSAAEARALAVRAAEANGVVSAYRALHGRGR